MSEIGRAIVEGQGHGVIVALLGFCAIAVLWVLVRPYPVGTRRRLILPAFLLALHAGTDTLASLLSPRNPLQPYVGMLALLFVLLALGRISTVLTLDFLLSRRRKHMTPRIVREIVEGALVVVAVLVTMRAGGLETSSVIATSAVLTAIIGLALQDTLGNLFAGLSLQAQRPFTVGEWIQVDREGQQLGEVLEINWRATRLLTADGSELTVPNAQLARAVIVNHSRPSAVARRWITITLPHHVSSARVHAVILNSVAQVPGVTREPPARVVTRGFVDIGTQYGVSFCIESFADRDVIEGAVRDRVLYALSRAAIPISSTLPAQPQPQHDSSSAPSDSLQARLSAVRTIDFLHDLPERAIETLAHGARNEHYEAGEIIVRQGETGDELYLCRSGELVVSHVPNDGLPREIAHLSAGAMFGELAQMSGEPRTATVQALTACELVVVGKSAFAQILRDNPGFAELISRRMAERQTALEEVGRTPSPDEHRSSLAEHRGRWLQRLREFFATT